MQYGPHDKPTMLLWMAMALTVLAACARMGQPDGGWYDETPPHIVSTSPADKSTGVRGKKVYINFMIELEFLNGRKAIGDDVEISSLLSC